MNSSRRTLLSLRMPKHHADPSAESGRAELRRCRKTVSWWRTDCHNGHRRPAPGQGFQSSLRSARKRFAAERRLMFPAISFV